MKLKTILSAGAMMMAVTGSALAATCGANSCAGKDKQHSNPCSAKNPCAVKNPCAAKTCAANPCAAKNPCAASSH